MDRVDVDEALNYARAYSGTPRSLEHARARSHSTLLVAGRIVGETRGGAGYGAAAAIELLFGIAGGGT